MVINRIVQLSPLACEEHLVSIVEPYKDVLYHHGLHTLSAVGQHTFIDGKAKSFAPTELLNLRHTRISKLWRR